MKTPDAVARDATIDVCSATPPSALAGSGRRLTAIEPRLGFTVGPVSGPGWVRLDRLDAATVTGWIDEKVAEVGGHRGIATGSVAEALARRVVAPSVACWAIEGWLPNLRPGNVLVHRNHDGVVDRTALSSALFAVPLTDPAAVDPWAWPLTSSRDLRRWLGVGLVRTLEPLFETVREAGSYGRRGLWGLAADSAGSALVRLVRLGLLDPAAGAQMWDEVDAAFQVVARLGTPARVRPQVRTERWGGTETLVTVRGVCCLYCATPAGASRPEPDRYCASCPRLGETDRMARLATVLHT